LFWLLLPALAHGASLSFSPSSGTYEPGTNIKVGVYADSEGVSLNAISGVVSFQSSNLEVVSISKSQSVISLWVQEPSFSNTEGAVRFEGIVLNPGYSGARGKVLDITFAVKSPGEADLSFSSGSILANDGEGSEILTSRNRAQFIMVASDDSPSDTSDAPITTDPAVPAILPEVVAVASTPSGWLAETTGVFSFALPEGVVAMRLLLDTKPNSTPTVVYQPPIASKTIEGLEEGTSYLHVQYKNAEGWGEVLHHEIKIDTKAPSAPVVKTVRQDTFLLSAEDKESGVEKYEIDIDGGEKFTLTGEAATVFVVPSTLALSQGQHVLTVRAFDQAGNATMTTTTFDYVPPVAVAANDDGVVPDTRTPDRESPVYSLLVPNGAILITVLSVIVPLLALIILLGILVYAAWRALGGLKRRVDKEAKEANEVVRRAFFVMRSDLEVDIETLKKANEKRKLTREESKILKRLQANINNAEQVIGKEISDIEDEVR
jgi:hypothetical protein